MPLALLTRSTSDWRSGAGRPQIRATSVATSFLRAALSDCRGLGAVVHPPISSVRQHSPNGIETNWARIPAHYSEPILRADESLRFASALDSIDGESSQRGFLVSHLHVQPRL